MMVSVCDRILGDKYKLGPLIARLGL